MTASGNKIRKKYKGSSAIVFPAFHPKALNDCCLIWQVFWLKAQCKTAFPFLKVASKFELLPKHPFRGWGLFTATGIAPDFNGIPF